MRWQLYLDELDWRCLGWSLAWQQECGLFLLEQPFYTASTMQRREQQHNRWRWPYLVSVAEDTTPMQPSVQNLLGSQIEDILGMAEDIYWCWYQLAPSIFTHQYQDLLMEDPHDELDWWLVRTCLHSTMCSGRYQFRGSACPMPLHRPTSHLELGHHHQRPAGVKASQPHSSVGTAPYIPVEYSLQAPNRARSTSALP